MLEAEAQNVIRRQVAIAIEFDVGSLGDLPHPVIGNPAPGGQSRKLAFQRHAASRLHGLLGQRHIVTPAAQHHRRFQSGGPRTDYQHFRWRIARPDRFRVPPAPPFLTERWVLGAARRRHGEVSRHAHVAADTLADILDAPLFDLFRQVRIGDRRPCRADEIENAVANESHHGIGRGEAANADHRLGGELLDAGNERQLIAFFGEARGLAVIVPARERQVPEVRQFRHMADHVARFRRVQAVVAHQFVDGDAAGNRAAIANGILGVFD